MRVIFCEYHPYRSILRVGSHAIAHELKRRGHEITWLAHPKTPWLQLLRRKRLPTSPRLHDDGTLEITLSAWAPYADVPGLSSVFWGKHWLRTARSSLKLKHAGLTHCDLLWISDFTMLPILDMLPANAVVFRVFDLIDSFKWMPSSIFDLIRHYQPQADLVLASSKGVQSHLRTRGIASVYVPNGADLSGFDPSGARSSKRQDVAVYVGALGPWFDSSAIELWATSLPEVRFEIAGPNPCAFHSNLPNVRFLGPVPRNHLPSLLQRAKLGLIPFRVNRLTRGVHPLKLYDYLAAGCPVLSADLPEVLAIPNAVVKYRRAEEAIASIDRLMKTPFQREELYAIALRNSWSRRLDQVQLILGLTLHPTSSVQDGS